MDWRHSASPYLAPAVLLVAQLVLLPVPLGTFVAGALAGLVGSLAAVGLALVWRASRVINFAAGDLGIVPATLAVLLADQWGWNYWACAAAGLAAAVVLGVAVEGLIIRRIFDAPRVLLTVATIGLAQLLGFGALILPRAWGASPSVRSLPEPFGMSIEIGGTVFDGSDLVALFVVPLLLIGLVLVLNRTALGVAIRASADRSSRALTLGIPVKRLQSLIWTLATVGAFVALFLTAGTGGLGVGYGTSLGLLLRAIAALVLGRMTHVGVIVFSSVVLGVLELAVRFQTGDGALVAPLLAAIIIGALLLRRMGVTRADRDDTSSWRLASDVRPVPAELARRWEVTAARLGLVSLGVTALAVCPFVLSTGAMLKLGAVLIIASVGVSLVILSGWAGQLSLGQMAFAGMGGAVFAWANQTHAVDPALAICMGAGAGAVAAVVVGLPALRIRGVYLAVTTLALAVACSNGVFDNGYFDWIPTGSFAGHRPALLGRIPMDTPAELYLLALGLLVVSLLAATALRRSRSGRVLIAIRENEDATRAYGVAVTQAKLAAFAVSGAIAGAAGAVFTLHQGAFKQALFLPEESVATFIGVVLGGLASLPGAVIGAFILRGSGWLLPAPWNLFATAAGALFVLLVMPDGVGGALVRFRDLMLSNLARRRGIIVPSLSDLGDPEVLTDASAGPADESVDESAEVSP